MTNAILIIGGNSAIAKALVCKIEDSNSATLISVKRGVVEDRESRGFEYQIQGDAKIDITLSSYSESCIRDVTTYIKNELGAVIQQVFICTGVLHSDTVFPERKLEEINAESFLEVMTANAVTPVLWLKHLVNLCKGNHNCDIVVFSARVGSISDNQLGGWYSYRASKAALNMAVKTAAIEYKRRAKNVRFTLFHPGTTDTELSKPFQKNVPKGKLFKPSFVATQLLDILEKRPDNLLIWYVDWQGIEIEF